MWWLGFALRKREFMVSSMAFGEVSVEQYGFKCIDTEEDDRLVESAFLG
jgi:hypothetical protein